MCKPLLLQKDAVICARVVQIIEKLLPQESIHILDVGSGEASLLASVCSTLHDKHPMLKLTVEAIEPAALGAKFIRDKARGLRDASIDVHTHQKPLEDYLDSGTKKFDVILCVHTMYFFEPENWPNIINNLSRRLKPKGRAIASNSHQPVTAEPNL